MPDGKVLVVAALAGILIFGAVKTVHGIKKLGQAIGHTVHHVVAHPVDSAKNGGAKK